VRRLRAAVMRLAALFRRGALDRDLAAEIDSHLAHHIDDNIRAGMTADEARRRALARLGGVAQVRERHREARGLHALDRFVTDVRYAVRALLKAPGFAAVAILSLAFGIGANATIFSVVNGLFFKPFPVDRPERLVSVARAPGFPGNSYPDYRDIRDRNTVLSGIAALRFSPMNLEVERTSRRTWGLLVSGNYFDVLGVHAALGRTLGADDDRVPGKHPVLVLSDAYWRSAFGADRGVVGRTVRVNGMPFTVLGVTPPGFRGTERLFVPDVWVPVAMVGHIESGNDWLERRQTQNVFLIGRLRDGISSTAAEASLNTIAGQLGREHAWVNEGLRFVLTPPGLMATLLRGPVAGFGAALLGVAGLVLLLTCTNLAGLMLARSADRQRDTAIRLALGAGRWDLIRRALIESAVVSVAGATGAIVLAWWLSAAITGWRLPTELPIAFDVQVDSRVFAVGAALAIMCTFLVGLLPAIQGSRGDIVRSLKDETVRWRGGWHARDAIVAAQVALSMVLLIGSLLVVRSLLVATRVDVGFVPDRAITLSLDLGLEGYDRARGLEFQQRIVERLRAMPGIDAAATASALPLTQNTSTYNIQIEGQPATRGTSRPMALYYQVSPGFFGAFGGRLVEGRDFTDADTPDRPPVAIVNETFARTLLGGNALGRRIRSGASGAWVEIVGIARDGKYQSLGENPTAVAFHSARQWYNSSTVIVARTSLDERSALDAARRMVHEIDPHLSVFADRPLRVLLALPLLPTQAAATLLGLFGALAIVMVLVGTYGVTSYAVAQRAREISIRIAIGASAPQVVRLVLGRGLVVWVVGMLAGLALAFVGAPLLRPILLGVAPRDPAVLATAVAIAAAVTCAAVWQPARRAIATSPSTLLRVR
jgi:macrolide transport system ATP-binding/permease protein